MSGMAFTLPHAFYHGRGASADVPGRFDVAINGRGYMIDEADEAFPLGRTTIPLIRDQADVSSEPSGASISPEDLWPREQESWHMGAGQEFLDAKDSDRARFFSSDGIDPWTWGKLKMLNDTEALSTSSNVNLQVLTAGDYLYQVDGSDVKWDDAPYSSFTSSDIEDSDTPGPVGSITSDGTAIYAALGVNGVHKTALAATTSAQYNALEATRIEYVKDRLMAVKGAAIYNITASGAAPSALFTHPNSSFTWVGFASGRSHIYAAGFAGDKSLIYKIPIKDDGSGLDTPIVAGELPQGEIIRSIVGYLGFVVVGTDTGFRLASQSESGDLTFGAARDLDAAVRCFEPQGRFLWFGWDDFDSARTGLGRIDLSMFTAPLVPAYSSDLMAAAQGEVTSICTTPDGKRAFTVSGEGLFIETDDPVASAQLISGKVAYDTSQAKIALRADIKHEALEADASVAIAVSADDRPFATAGTSNIVGETAPESPFKVPELNGVHLQVRLTLIGGVVVERYALRSFPTARRGEVVILPLRIFEETDTVVGECHYDTKAEFDYLNGLVGSKRINSLKELGAAGSMVMSRVSMRRHSPTKNRMWWNHTAICEMKILGE